MKEKKNILVFCYRDMRLGGIQKIIYSYIQYFLDRGGKVIWIAPRRQDVASGYRKLVNRDTIAICSQAQGENILKELCREYDATVVILNFRPSDYIKMARLERSLEGQDVRNYLAVAHYKGTHLFLEENYRGRKRLEVFETARGFYESLLRNKSMFFCSVKQAEAFEEHYRIPIADKPGYVIPATSLPDGPEDSCILERFGKQNIISVCRFSFPHKGYVLGLVQAYGALKERFPELKLTLIGYGDGEKRVRKCIQALSSEARKDITIIPGAATEKLPHYYAQASVAVGLAGAASTSAAEGLITLVARHYCEDCEVYGSYPDCWEKTVCEEPGVDILPELERVLKLDKEQYLAESRATRQAYENRMLPRLRDICRDYSVLQPCLLQEKEWSELRRITGRAELLLRLKRFGYLLTHPGPLLKKLKGIIVR